MGTMRMTADAMPGPSRHTFRDDVLEGLSQKHKTIPAKYLYDARGSRLYDEICELVEYYPTRTELGILRERAVTIGSILGPGARVVELGSGSSNNANIIQRGGNISIVGSYNGSGRAVGLEGGAGTVGTSRDYYGLTGNFGIIGSALGSTSGANIGIASNVQNAGINIAADCLG